MNPKGGDAVAGGDNVSSYLSPAQQILSHANKPFPAPSIPKLLQAGSISPRTTAGLRESTSLLPASVSPLGKRGQCLCMLLLKRTGSFFFPVLLPCKELKCSLNSGPKQALEGTCVYRHVQAAERWVVWGGFHPKGMFSFFWKRLH